MLTLHSWRRSRKKLIGLPRSTEMKEECGVSEGKNKAFEFVKHSPALKLVPKFLAKNTITFRKNRGISHYTPLKL